jgi:hypothetical protein
VAGKVQERDSALHRRRALFFQLCGKPEFEGVWISDSMWISMGPTMLTPRCTVESLQASLEAPVFRCSKPCLVPGEVMFFESPWLVFGVQVVFLY